ncbi:MAG: hypothetical protein ACFFDC_16735 [Promethearchaeota archaeon]
MSEELKDLFGSGKCQEVLDQMLRSSIFHLYNVISLDRFIIAPGLIFEKIVESEISSNIYTLKFHKDWENRDLY